MSNPIFVALAPATMHADHNDSHRHSHRKSHDDSHSKSNDDSHSN